MKKLRERVQVEPRLIILIRGQTAHINGDNQSKYNREHKLLFPIYTFVHASQCNFIASRVNNTNRVVL